MKKTLLLAISLITVLSLSAQRYQIKDNIRPEFRTDRNFNESLINNSTVFNAFNIPEKPVVDAGDRDIVSVIPIGGAANAYGLYNGGRTALWADNNLNTVAFIHRMLIPPGGGYLAYDLSTDGGMTFTNNIQVYDPNLGGANARYPQGVIYNPTGNTNPDNAYYSYFAPSLDGSNAGPGSWGGYVTGVHKLSQTEPPTQHYWSSIPPFRQNVPSAMTINPVNGDIWVFEPALVDGIGNQYTDSILFTKGTWNSELNDYDYERWVEYLPAYEPGRAPADEKIAFAPDGQIGYMSFLADNGGDPFAAGHAFYPVIYKTTDGGQTWTGPTVIVLGGPDGFDEVKYYLTDEQIIPVNPGFEFRDSILYTTAFTHDMVVDKNGDIHICVTIGVAGSTEYSIIASGGYGATFHIYSINQGACFAAQYITHNKTFRGEWGDLTEDNRSQASRTQDGSKIFLSWADTDFEGVTDNVMPDIWCWGFDVDTRMFTDVVNVTYLSEGWLEAYQCTASHYIFSGGDTYTIPFVYQTFTGGDPLEPVQFKYIQDFTFTDADFTNGPHVPPTCGTPCDANGDGMVNIMDVVAMINYIMGNDPDPFIVENADINGDGIINVLDAVGTVNIILGGRKGEPKSTYGSNIMKINDVTAEPGNTIIVEMEIINEDLFVAWQFDIPLPDGFEYVANSAALTDRATDHQIHANVLPNTNLFRSLSISFTNSYFLGNSGIVATYEFNTPDEAGVYDFVLEDAIISSIQAQNIITGTEDATITLEGAIEQYTVTFVITDQFGNEIDDAVVTLGDVTNAAGDYIFVVEPGTYSYSVGKYDFETETGDVTVIDQDVIVPVILYWVGINELQSNFTITSIYPNPAKNYTNLKLTLNKRSNVAIDITNILGQKVQTVNSGTFDAGEQCIKVDTEGLRSGMYFLTVKTNDYKTTNKLIVE
ncbi:MAG: T9SS type A sorting domain-containing protein [Bacteroidales bacterium]